MRKRLIIGACCALAAAAQLVFALGMASGKVEVELEVEGAQAWKSLADSASSRLNAAEGEASIVRGIVQELNHFAEAHPQTNHAAIALFNGARLAAGISDFDLAEKSIEAARGHTQDPKILQAIDAELAGLKVRVGKPAPPLAVDEWVRGKPATLDELKGKVVLLDVFQIICPGCHKAHPEIVRMQKQYKDKGFEVLGLAVAFELHYAQTPEKIRRYVNEKAYPYPVALDKGLIETFRRYGARGTPYTALIDRQGRIRYLDFFRVETVESTLRRLLDED